MKKHTDIKDIVNQINEARNVLTYTFQFSYNKEVIEQLSQYSDKEKFETLFKHIHTACRPLFCSSFNEKNTFSLNKGLEYGQWQFFGDEVSDTSQKAYPVGPLRYLDTFHSWSIWEKILTHHCLLATYDKLHNIIFNNIQFTGYNISRHLGCTGIHYALTHNFLHLEVSEGEYIVKELDKKCRNAVIDSNTASNYGRNSYPQCFSTLKEYFTKYNTYKDLAKQITLTYTPDNKPFSVTVPGNLLPLLQQLRGRGKNLANIFNLYDGQRVLKQADIDKFHKSVSEIQGEPIKPLHGESESSQMTYTDEIYYKHKLEQTFNFNLVNCITKNIQVLDERFNQRFCEDVAFIDSVVAFINFPNTNSRHLLIQMAFDCCSDYLSPDTSSLVQRINTPDVVAIIDKHSTKWTTPYNLFSKWQETCTNFINYMAEIVFPVYESYFFVAIYDLISKPELSPEQTLLTMYLELGNYINTLDLNYESKNDFQANYNNALFDCSSALSAENVIVPKYPDNSIRSSTFSKVALSTYNHLPEPKPILINRNFLYENFSHSKDCYLTSCIADILL